MKSFDEILVLIRNGNVGILPSDTIYGLSCLALDQKAVQKIYSLKGRDYDKPLIILLSDSGQAAMLGLDAGKLEPVLKYWPGPLTVVVPAGKNTPEFLHRGSKTLAVRVPGNRELRELIKQAGPIVSTSANPQGKPSALTVRDAKKYFGDKLDFYFDVGKLKSEPSTIAQLQDGKLKIVRRGALKI